MRRPAILLAALLLPAAALAQGAGYGAQPAPAAGPDAAAEPGTRSFHIVNVHLDGNTGLTATASHPAEPFPAGPLPAGGGLILREPDAEGRWGVRAFVFQPPQVVVRQGDRVALTFVAVQGPSFRIVVEGTGEAFTLKRGEARTVAVATDRPGPIAFRALDRGPSMAGEVLVLPR